MKTGLLPYFAGLIKSFTLAACCCTPGAAFAAQSTLSADSMIIPFTRRSSVGARHHFSIFAEKEESAELSLPNQIPGSEHNQMERYTININGTLEILAVNTVGNATRLKLHLNAFDAQKNDVSIPITCKHKVILADLSNKDPIFLREDRVILQPYEHSLLGLVFRPAMKETMNDLFGPDRPFTPGLAWRPPTESVMRAIRANQINLADSELTANAKVSPCTIDSQKCWRADLTIRTPEVRQDIGFTFNIAMILPEISTEPALRLKRECEFITRQPFSAPPATGQKLPDGTLLIQRSKEIMTAEIKSVQPD